ncbi:MAG: YceI family protein [Flavobacteriales bacterium]|nr:YceI family protein [Flavobacteriales bacterium]
MKKLTLLILSGSLLVACNSSDEPTVEHDAPVQEAPAPVVSDYALNASASSADWERTLDQKATKQKVKLFGKMVDVELGEVKMTTTGSVNISEGGLTLSDNDITSAHVVFDMASFQLAKEKDSGLFDVKQYPNSTLMLNDFSDSTATGTLTIQQTSKEVPVKISVTKSDQTYTLKGSFTVNTLDFPLREKVKEKDVNKDEILVNFDLNYSK